MGAAGARPPSAAPHPQPAAGSRPRRRLPPGSAASAPAARRDPTRCDSGAIASVPPLPRAGQGAGTAPHPPGRAFPHRPRSSARRVASRGGPGAGGAGAPPQSRSCAPHEPLTPTTHGTLGRPGGGSPPNVGRAALVAAASGHGPGAAVPVPVPAPVPVPVLGSGGAAGLPVPSGTKPRLFAEGTAARGRLLMRPMPAGVPAPGHFSP